MGRERRESGERIENLELGRVEAPRLARADAEDPPHLAEPRHRGDHDLFELREVLARRRLLGARERTVQNGPPGLDRLGLQAGGSDSAVELLVLGQAEDRAAAERVRPRLEHPAVGRVRLEEAHDLVDQPPEDRLEPKVRRDHLRRLEERLLQAEPALVVAQQARRMNRETDLAGDRLGERRRRRRTSAAPRAGGGRTRR